MLNFIQPLFLFLLQVYDDFEYNLEGAEEGLFAALGVLIIVYLAFLIFYIVVMWKIFVKAGKPGWAAIVPIYNIIVLLEIVGRPVWWLILILLVPCANIVCMIILCIDLAKSFGKDAAFGVGIILLGFIFLPILAFSKNINYVGPAAAPKTGA